MIKVLVVEDSPVIQAFLTHILSSDPDVEVIGAANNGEEALRCLNHMKPDVITMDMNMPKMNGFEASRRIMETAPVPIVIVSGSIDQQEVAYTFKALEAGAVAVVGKPSGMGHPAHEAMVRELIDTVKLMSEVKVVRRWPARGATPPVKSVSANPATSVRIVAIGASTGGPVALNVLLSKLDKDFPLPIVIVQHMSPGFLQGFVDWLAQSSQFSVRLGSQGEKVVKGGAYVAPEGHEMGIGADGRIELMRGVDGAQVPSVSHMFRSVSANFGSNAIGVLLSGMGRDGAEELKTMHERGATTIVQDAESSVIFGMPGEAVKLGAADHILPPGAIAAALELLARGGALKNV
jgi:two-component system, chemotaxis family, protein-glutamate methylesterase/glutaminase